jgi:hypothetical protein
MISIGAGSNNNVTATSNVSRAYAEKLERENAYACAKIQTGDSRKSVVQVRILNSAGNSQVSRQANQSSRSINQVTWLT